MIGPCLDLARASIMLVPCFGLCPDLARALFFTDNMNLVVS